MLGLNQFCFKQFWKALSNETNMTNKKQNTNIFSTYIFDEEGVSQKCHFFVLREWKNADFGMRDAKKWKNWKSSGRVGNEAKSLTLLVGILPHIMPCYALDAFFLMCLMED